MKLLLDTHVVIALIDESVTALPPTVGRLLEAQDAELLCSVASLWEIAIKHRLGKLPLCRPLDALPDAIAVMGVDILAVSVAHVLTSVEPEPPTRDPFDRLLIAQAIHESLPILTHDEAFARYPVKVIW